jgi:glyoxylase-like metal-dependent hydrolase (beta-lactamase superfamily II)
MTNDRRKFLRTGLGGLAGLTSLPLLGSLGGCQQLPVRQAGQTARSKTAPAKELPITRVTDRISVITEAPGNVLVLSTGDGVLLVDAGSVELAPAVRKSLAGATVHTMFNTHYHADQTGGNALFASTGTEIHAQTITKQWLAADYYVPAEDRWVKAPPKEAVPKVTFRGKGDMKAGSEAIEFGYLQEAHTRGDAYIFFRDSNVLAAGDVVSPLRDPALDWYSGAWMGARADAVDDLVKLANEQTLIVPAYGKVMTYAELQAERDLMAKLYDVTSALYHKGHSAEDMMSMDSLKDVGRTFKDPYRFLYDAVKGYQAHYTNFGGNVV